MKKIVALFLCAIMMLPAVNNCGRLNFVHENIIVTLTESDPDILDKDISDTDISERTRMCGRSLCEAAEVIGRIPQLNISYSDNDFIVAEFDGTSPELNHILNKLQAEPSIMCAEVDAGIALTAISDDYFSSSQYWLDNTGKYTKQQSGSATEITSTPDIDIDAPEGWAEYKRASSERSTVVVAVIDTGIDYKHADLADSMWINPGEIPDNGIDDDGNGYVDDVYGWDFYNGDGTVCHYAYYAEHDSFLASPYDNDNHGTHCAGIIAATANNGIGIAGAAACADVRLMSLKVHGGSDRGGMVSDAIKAIRYAEMMGAKVCNISWGAYSYSLSLYTAIERSNMLFVCAAGNDGTDNDIQPIYPASYDLDNIISVSYVDAGGAFPFNANYGAETVDVVAPAVDVFSTVVGSYGLMSGSSMAAPQVSAIAAVMYTFGDGLYASNVKDVILSNIKPLDGLTGLMKHAGIPSLYSAVAHRGELKRDLYAPEFDLELLYKKGDLVMRIDAEDIGESGINSVRYFTGRKNEEYFANGTQGTVVAGNKLTLAKGGLYTFYINDRAGNSVTKTLKVIDDLLAPTIRHVYVRYDNDLKEFTIDAEVYDLQSDVRTVKYLPGKHDAGEFAFSSIPTLKPDEADEVHFKTAEEGTYSLYASDNRGNSTVTLIRAYKRPITEIEVRRDKKSLDIDQTWAVKYNVFPENTTDVVHFSSSDESIATVSSTGRVKALSEGECVITLTSDSGKTDECRIVVKIGEEADDEEG